MQHGFERHKSCITNMLETFDIITHCAENNLNVDIVFLDFCSAFNKVSHKLLCSIKLEAYGINGKIKLWITEFLRGRKQRVILGGSESEWVDVHSGIPQGTVIAALLFSIYINDLTAAIKNHTKLFADDTKLIGILHDNSSVTSIQNDINHIANWCSIWRMELNESKCKVLHIGKSNTRAIYTINSTELLKVEEERDLGIIISSDLKWDKHIRAITTKANYVWGQIKNSFKFLNKDTFKMIFVALVRPHLEYGAAIWNPFLAKDIDSIESIQRRATKSIPECRRMNYETRLKSIQLPTLEYRRHRGDIIQYYKIHKNLNKVNWYTKQNISSHEYPTRHHNTITREINKSNIRFNFFKNRIVDQWNKIPSAIREAENTNAFKNNYDKLLLF